MMNACMRNCYMYVLIDLRSILYYVSFNAILNRSVFTKFWSIIIDNSTMS